MSFDMHHSLPQAASRDIAAADEKFDEQDTWTETTITVGAVITVVIVSFVAVMMAMA